MAPDNAPALEDLTDPTASEADSPVMPIDMADFAAPADVVDATPVKAAVPPPPPTEAGMKILLDGFHAWLPLSSVVTVPLTVGFLPLPLRSLASLTLAKGQWKFSEAGYITRS